MLQRGCLHCCKLTKLHATAVHVEIAHRHCSKCSKNLKFEENRQRDIIYSWIDYRMCPVDDFLETFTNCRGLLGDYNAPNMSREKRGEV